jgi:hypothetical protein
MFTRSRALHKKKIVPQYVGRVISSAWANAARSKLAPPRPSFRLHRIMFTRVGVIFFILTFSIFFHKYTSGFFFKSRPKRRVPAKLTRYVDSRTPSMMMPLDPRRTALDDPWWIEGCQLSWRSCIVAGHHSSSAHRGL